jgi:hypothetical protein
LPLIFLAAAAAPQTDCSNTASSWDPAPAIPSSVAPAAPDEGSMTTQGNPAPAVRQALAGCGPATATYTGPSSLRQENDEVLHGLETGGALAPVDQPRQAPLFH